MVKIKDKNHHLAIAIQENFAHGMKPKEIADLFHLSKQRVNYWLHHIIKKRKRRTKLNRREINLILKWAKDKPIMEKKVSARNIQIKFNKLRNKGISNNVSIFLSFTSNFTILIFPLSNPTIKI